jgi:signal transduction histidine kinase
MLSPDHKEAEKAYLISLNVTPEFKDQDNRNEFILYSNLINLYYETDQIEKGIKTIEKANALYDQDSTLFTISETYQANGAKLFYKIGNKKRADKFFEQFLILKDSLFSKENALALADVEAKLKTKEKEAELAEAKNQLLEKELKVKQQNFLIYGGLSVLVLLIVLSYFIIRSKQLKNKQLKKEAELQKALAKIELKNKLEEQRIRISKDLHDNIGSQLTFVISGLQFIEYQKDISIESIKSKLQSIGNFTQQTIHELRDTIWAMNKEEIQLSELISRLRNFVNRLSIPEKISINTSKSVEPLTDRLIFSALEGIQIYRIIQEAVNNAIKYAEAKEIKIDFEYDSCLNVEISDNGKGFDLTAIKKGNGIKNMKSRAKKLEAEFEIDSKKDLGTRVILSLPELSK